MVDVVGLDNMNAYYDPALKQARCAGLVKFNGFRFTSPIGTQLQLCSKSIVFLTSFTWQRRPAFDIRWSNRLPLTGFTTILEGCRHIACRHLFMCRFLLLYGSTQCLFSVHGSIGHPLNLYGASKKANELMSHAYTRIPRVPMTPSLTVYGPWAVRIWQCGFS